MPQHKEKNFDDIKPNVSYAEMDDETAEIAYEICREAYKMQHDGELKYFKDMASFVKTSMEEKVENTCWHVVAGTNFGSFVSYEHKSVNLFWLEHIGFLLWRHG